VLPQLRCVLLAFEKFIKLLKFTEKMVSVLQTIDSGHEDLIHGAEIDYYGLNLATCSSDNSIKVRNLKVSRKKSILFVIICRSSTLRTEDSV